MLLEKGRPDELEAYIKTCGRDRDLIKWWARYCESIGDVPRAVAAYTTVQDQVALVRNTLPAVTCATCVSPA